MVLIGCSIEEALRLVQIQRSPDRILCFPVIVPVRPQPSAAAVCLALPAWTNERFVLMDCSRVNGAMFCALSAAVTTRASLLAVARLERVPGMEVFVHERPLALTDHDAIGVQNGFCVTFVPPNHPAFAVAFLEDMLFDPLTWNLEAEIPAIFGRWVFLLTDDENTQVLPSPQRSVSARLELAALLEYDPTRMVVQPSVPAIRDHFDYGILADTVMIASQAVASDANNVLYVLDMRPILCGLTWGVARQGRVATRPILDRFGALCPHGYKPVLQGGAPEPPGFPDCLRVAPGNVLTIAFVEVDATDEEPAGGDDPAPPSSGSSDSSDTGSSDDADFDASPSDSQGASGQTYTDHHGSRSSPGHEERSRSPRQCAPFWRSRSPSRRQAAS